MFYPKLMTKKDQRKIFCMRSFLFISSLFNFLCVCQVGGIFKIRRAGTVSLLSNVGHLMNGTKREEEEEEIIVRK